MFKSAVEKFAESKGVNKVDSWGVNFHSFRDKEKNVHEFSRFPNAPVTYTINKEKTALPDVFVANFK